MPKIIRINTKHGPKALGPYSTASVYNGTMYVSGQIGIDPASGDLVGNDVESQTKRAMDNLKIFFDEIKLDMSNIIKSTVYLKVFDKIYRTCLILQRLTKFMENTLIKIPIHHE